MSAFARQVALPPHRFEQRRGRRCTIPAGSPKRAGPCRPCEVRFPTTETRPGASAHTFPRKYTAPILHHLPSGVRCHRECALPVSLPNQRWFSEKSCRWGLKPSSLDFLDFLVRRGPVSRLPQVWRMHPMLPVHHRHPNRHPNRHPIGPVLPWRLRLRLALPTSARAV